MTPDGSVQASLARRLASRLGQRTEGSSEVEAMEERLFDELLRRSQVTIGFLIPVLFVLRGDALDAFERSLSVRIAFAATLGLFLLRWAFVIVWRRMGARSQRPPASRRTVFSALTIASGVGLGAINVLVFPLLSDFHVSVIGSIQIAICALALSSMAGSLWLYLMYMFPNLGSFFLMVVLHPRPEFGLFFPSLSFLVLPALTAMAFHLHQTLRRSFELEIQLADLALRDGLTHLRNRRFLSEFMIHETARALVAWSAVSARREMPARGIIGVLVLDFDHFKDINDKYGHAAGDAVLQQVARVIERLVRGPDLVVRWGGEEFVVIARDAHREGITLLAERLLRAVENERFRLPSGEEVQRTISIGYAVFPFKPDQPAAVGWEGVLTVADHALFLAKAQGRNRSLGVVPGETPWVDLEVVVAMLEKDFPSALKDGFVRIVG